MTENDDHNGGLVAALRSVWFYYIACTPCRKIGHRRETRKEAERERVIKARLEMEQPGLYRHPNPENTNQYWMEDINMGPSLPKRGVSQNTSQRKLKSSGTEVTDRTNGASSPRDRQTSIGSSTHFHSAETASSPTVVAEDYELRTTLSMSVTDSQDLDWNRKRYEREDEELWGHQMANKAGQRLRDVITKGRDTAGRLFETGRPPREREITEDDRSQFYGTPRNPPVNDYHPPVVSSRPSSRNEYRWMLQPPPPAKVMEGKVPVSRSGSQTSIASRGSRASRASRKTTTAASHASKEELGLGRLVGERIVKDKIRKGELPNEAEGSIRTAQPDTRRSRTGSTLSSMPSQRSHRSHVSARSRSNTTGSSDSSDTIYERRMKRRASKQKKAEAAAGSEADDETDNEEQRPHGSEGYVVQRPRLQTIASSDLSSKKSEASSPAVNSTILATMSGTTPATESMQSSQGSPLEDVTNRSVPTAAASPVATANKERPAGASVDSGLALS